jgi:hypothetical protein
MSIQSLTRDTWVWVFDNFDLKDPKQIYGLFGACKWLRETVARYFGPRLRTTYVLRQQMLPRLYPDMCERNVYDQLRRWKRPDFEAAYQLLQDAEIVSLWMFYTAMEWSRKMLAAQNQQELSWKLRDIAFQVQCGLDTQEIAYFRHVFNKHWNQARCVVVVQMHPEWIGELDARIAEIQRQKERLEKELQHAQRMLAKK